MSSSLRDLFKQMERTSIINKDFYSAIGAVEQSRKLWANAIGPNISALHGALGLKLGAMDRSALHGALGLKLGAMDRSALHGALGLKLGAMDRTALHRAFSRKWSSLDMSKLTQAVQDAVQHEDSSEFPPSYEISEVVETISFIDKAKKPIVILEEFYKKYPATFNLIVLFIGLFCGVVKSYNSINVTIIKSIALNPTINHVTNYKPNNIKINGSNNITIVSPQNVNIYHSQKVEVESTVFDSYRFVNCEELNIKLSNNKKSKVVDTIYARQSVEFIEKKGKWVRIKYKKDNEVNKEGWVLSKYLSRYRKLLKGINYRNKINEIHQP